MQVVLDVRKEDPAVNLAKVLAVHTESLIAALDGQAVVLGAPAADAKILGEEDAKVCLAAWMGAFIFSLFIETFG